MNAHEKLAHAVRSSISEKGAGYRDDYVHNGQPKKGITESNLRNFLSFELGWKGLSSVTWSFDDLASIASLKIRQGNMMKKGRATKRVVYFATAE